jgi:hypothetical protein
MHELLTSASDHLYLSGFLLFVPIIIGMVHFYDRKNGDE